MISVPISTYLSAKIKYHRFFRIFYTSNFFCIKMYAARSIDRLSLLIEPPQPTKKCPRRNGFFAHPDPTVCNVFYNCIDGEAIEITCTTGLHFDEYSGTCVWPDSAGREVRKLEKELFYLRHRLWLTVSNNVNRRSGNKFLTFTLCT